VEEAEEKALPDLEQVEGGEVGAGAEVEGQGGEGFVAGAAVYI